MSEAKRFWVAPTSPSGYLCIVGDVVPTGIEYPTAMVERRREIGICDKSWRAAPLIEIHQFWLGNRTLVKIDGHEGFYLVSATEIKKD